LQVKLFEPSIALETCIVLNLNVDDFYYRTRIDTAELAIVIAASIANWIAGHKQMVGMMVNGRDPLTADGKPQTIPPHKGKRHLIRLLETLARIEMTDQWTLVPLIQRQHYQLRWGTTLIVITGKASDELIHELYQAQRGGQNAVLILVGMDASGEASRRRAQKFGIPVCSIASERDLNIWMQKSKRI
jgi:uncharacterized protein (DUF58 family)